MIRSLLLPLLLLASAAGAATSARPNFVVINIDDLGYHEIGPFGSTNRTPNLDRMAAEGRKLSSHYAAPVCSPSRCGFMTSHYPARHGIHTALNGTHSANVTNGLVADHVERR